MMTDEQRAEFNEWCGYREELDAFVDSRMSENETDSRETDA